MKTFKQHLLESARVYKFRIKLSFVPSEKELNSLEHFIKKYEPIEISAPRKTIVQRAPLDFRDIENAEVTIIDVILSLPASSYILQQEIKNWMDIPERFIVVRGENEPMELETDYLNARYDAVKQAKEQGLTPKSLLSTDSEYFEYEQTPDGTEYFGDKQTTEFKKYLQKIQASRKISSKPVYSGDASVFDINAKTMDDNHFNSSVPDAPKSYPAAFVDDKDIDLNSSKMTFVNFLDDFGEYKFAYENPENGKTVIIQKKIKALK